MTAPGPPEDRVTGDLPGPAEDRVTADRPPGAPEPAPEPASDRVTGDLPASDRVTADLPRPADAEPPTPGLPAHLAARLTDARLMSERGGQAMLFAGLWDGQRQAVVKMSRARADAERVWDLWRYAAEHDDRVVPLLHAETFGLHDFEVMPLLEHGSLHAHRTRLGRALTEAEALAVLTEVAGALEHLHDRVAAAAGGGVRALVHGDVKPANILVRSLDPLRLCVSDFGIAGVHEFTREPGADAMSAEYAAPELFRRSRSPAVDWWALGMTLLELLQGYHPFRVDGALLSEDEINHLVNTAPVPMADDLPERWPLLLRGLLTWRPEARWAARQVHEWLEGGHPPVDEGIGLIGDPRADHEFEFAGGRFVRPPELAAAMAVDWQAAGDLMLGDDWPRLIAWAGTAEPALRSALEEVDELFVRARMPIDRCVSEVVVRLDPAARPRFRGLPADRAGLVALASDPERGPVLDALLTSGSLRALSRLPDQGGLDLVDGRWQLWSRLAEGHLGTVPDPEGRVPRALLPGLLLNAALDPVYRDNLRARARALATRRARRSRWFRALTDIVPGVHAPASDAVIVLTAALARHRPPRRERDNAMGDAARGLRAEVDALLTGAAAPDDWLAAVPRLPHRFEPVTRQDRSDLRRAVVGVLVVGAVVAVLIGVAVGEATSVAQGALTTLVLLAATAALLGGLLMPPSPLAGVLLGAVAGLVAGLPVAASAGVLTGLVLGPVVGVPVFWLTWSLSAAIGAAVGAVRKRTREDMWT